MCCRLRAFLFFFEKQEKQAKKEEMKRHARFSLSTLTRFLHFFTLPFRLSFPEDRRDARMRHRRFLLMLLARSPVPFYPRRCSAATASGSSSSSSSASVSASAATATTTVATAATPIPATTLASSFAALRLSSSSALLRGGPRASPGRCASLVYTDDYTTRARLESGRALVGPDG